MSTRLLSNPFWWLMLLLAVGVGAACYFVLAKPESPSQKQSQSLADETSTEQTESVPAPEPIPATAPQTAQPTWPVSLTIDQAASITVVVNKKHKLPSSYAPKLQSVSGGQLRSEAAEALTRLLNDASASGAAMKIVSSYRSYSTQVSTYNKWVQQYGQAEADRVSARPGHSEHQTGLAADLGNPNGSCDLEICFGDSAAGKWLAAHAADYGFIIRYPADKETETGYSYEPWHIRYVGTDVAKAVVASGKTLDQYYNVPAGGY